MPRHFLHVGADPFAQISDFVDEGDLGREERIGGVFDQLCGSAPGVEDGSLVQIKRPVKLGHHVLCAWIVGADDDAVRVFEVLDGGAFAQELGVRDHGEIGVGARFLDDALHLIAGADRHGGLGDDDGEAGQGRSNLARGRVHVREVCMTIAAARRRADRDEYRVRLDHRVLEVRGEGQPAFARVGRDHVVEARLINRNLVAAQRRDLGGIAIDAGDVMTKVCKARARDQPDVTRPDHCNPHAHPCSRHRGKAHKARALRPTTVFPNPARLLAEGLREREPDGDCGLSPRDIAAARA
jgi:hypothetical protein